MKPSTPLSPPVGTAQLVIDPPVTVESGEVEFSARIIDPHDSEKRIWFRFPEEEASWVSRRADPFVIATLVYAMSHYAKLEVHGTVSPGLLANLTDFQSAYNAFHRGQLTPPMEITATVSADSAGGPTRELGISAFSGGVDSCFTVYRHTHRSPMEPKRALGATLMMHGFDIPVTQPEVFARAAARSRAITDDAKLALHTGATNLRTLAVKWEDIYATAVAAALSFFQPRYAYGLLPSFQDWAHTKFNYGSSPLTDPMLSSLAFPIVHDGTAFGRLEKLRGLARWPAALRHLRVCWQGAEMDRNCCRCEKCVRTILMLELVGVRSAEAFPQPLDLAQLDQLVIKGPNALEEQIYLLTEARRLGLNAPWMKPVARSIRRNARRQQLWRTGKAIKGYMPQSVQTALHSLGRRWLWHDRTTPVSAGEAAQPAAPAGPLAEPSSASTR
ncbi:MAG TPA: hypothetical protein VEQ65_00140 [Opitutus sp.]|nr:hypothetical protein [Opitutus sp.]